MAVNFNPLLMSNKYIYFAYQHLMDIRPWGHNAGIQYFQNEFRRQIGQLESRALSQTLEAAWLQNPQIQNALRGDFKNLDTLQNQQVTRQLIDAYAQALDTQIQQRANIFAGNLPAADEIKNSLANYQTLLEGSVNLQRVNDFFQSIDTVLTSINQSPLDPTIVQQLIGYISTGQQAIGNSALTSINQLKKHKKIFLLIYRAFQSKIEQGNDYSSNQFTGTLLNLFNGELGEATAEYMLRQAERNVISQADIAVNDAMVKAGGKFTNVGGKYTVSNTRATVDLLKSKALSLQVQDINGTNFRISIDSNASVKWRTGKKQSVTIVSGVPITTLLPAEGSVERWMAENIIAHRRQAGGKRAATAAKNGDTKVFRQFLAASFFNNWISGSGQSLKNGGVDTNEILVVDGRILSIPQLMADIAKKYEDGATPGRSPFGFDFNNTVENKWKDGPASWQLAKERSDQARASINALKLSAHFNANFIKQYI